MTGISAGVLAVTLLLLAVGAMCIEETTTTATEGSVTTTMTTTTTSERVVPKSSEKIARRIIDDRLTPPRATDYSTWKVPLGEVRASGPRVTEDVDDNVTDKVVPKKTRTVGPTQGKITVIPRCSWC